MDQFLQLCHSSLSNLSQFKVISLVIGNEACDLDSTVSAIVLAYVKYHELLSKPDAESSVLVLPILNVPRDELHLRRDTVFWFENVLQIDLKLLICRDEIDFAVLNSPNVSVTLVDHNENKELSRLLPHATFDEVLDHHKKCESVERLFTDSNRVQIDPTVGSCSSLVALRFLKCNLSSHFDDQQREVCLDSQIALILYGPILLDTICFDHQAKRYNLKDYEAINKLEDLLKHNPDAEASLFDRNEVYHRLADARNSLEGLSFTDLLRKDMKIVESKSDHNLAICISSITGTLLTELSLKDNINELRSFCNSPPQSAIFSESRSTRLFNAIVLLSLDNRIQNNLRRQLSLYCANKHLMRTIATCIERSELELELITASETLRIYNQNNLHASRKVVLPIISTILNGPDGQQSKIHDAGQISRRYSPSDAQFVNLIATAEVDPEFLLTYKAKSISVPEFEEFLQQNIPNQTDSVSPSPEEHAKQNGVSLASAPSSLIQAPDSYYGSYIEDSFVGEFVGDYMDPTNDHTHENILVMDADGQNLVMLNPNEKNCISHTHEIEFDFDSFGPESIIYAGNVDVHKQEDNTGTNTASESLNGDDSGFDKDVESSDEKTIEKASSLEEELSEKEEKSISNTPTSVVNGSRPEENILNPANLLSMSNQSFSRNNTLTRSQRKKVSPPTAIKSLLEMDSPVTQTTAAAETPAIQNDENAVTIVNDENFIVSSPIENEEKPSNSDPPNSLHESLSSSSLGLQRQPSMRKKIPVNYNMFLHHNYESQANAEVKPPAEGGESVPAEQKEEAAVPASGEVETKDQKLPEEEQRWRQSLPLSNGEIRMIDMKVIEPYKRVISHGGYLHTSHDSSPAIIVFSACYLPDRSRVDYHYVMDNLFMYVLTTLHNMIGDDYLLIYLHNASQASERGNNMPTFSWLKRCYQMIDRRLKKNLKGLYLVHPTFWLKTLIIMTKPFISSKFSRKLKFVRSLEELSGMIPLEHLSIPESVRIYDEMFTSSSFAIS